MAQVFSEGFDTYATTTEMFASRFTAGSAVAGGTLTIAPTASNFGTPCVNYFNGGTAANVYLLFPAVVNLSATKLCVGFWYKHTAVTTAQNLFVVTATAQDGVLGTPAPLININATGFPIVFMPNAAGGVTSTVSIADNSWHWVEGSWDLNFAAGVTGFARLYVDGNLVASTSSSARTSSITPPTAFRFVMQANNSNQCWMDDLSIWDNTGSVANTTPLGKQRIMTLVPNAAGASTQFTNTGTASSNAAAVNSSWTNSANYVSGTAGVVDTYQLSTSQSIGNVIGVSTIHRAYAASAAVATFLPTLALSGTVATNAQVSLTTTPVIVQQFWPMDPSNNPWVPKTFSMLQMGQTAT
jgi:hypothetical protein